LSYKQVLNTIPSKFWKNVGEHI